MRTERGMSMVNLTEWWKAALIRAIRTFAEAALAYIGTGAIGTGPSIAIVTPQLVVSPRNGRTLQSVERRAIGNHGQHIDWASLGAPTFAVNQHVIVGQSAAQSRGRGSISFKKLTEIADALGMQRDLAAFL